MPDQPKLKPARDFQQHLADLEKHGLLVRVDRPINKDTELQPLVRWQFVGGVPEDQRRAFLFTNVVDGKGRRYDMPVAIGVYASSPQIYARGMGQKVEDIGKALSHAILPQACMKRTRAAAWLLATVGWLALITLSAASAQTALTGSGQAYPTRSIRIIGPSSPGGGIDATGRILAAALTQSLGQQVVLENRPGAGGIIGTEIVAKAPPDGYTLMLTAAAALVVFPHTFSKLPYDPIRDFAPISLVAASDYILAVHPSLPVKTVKDLVALARARPGQIVFASTGNFSLPHLAGELLMQQGRFQMLHVPYKGGGPAAMAILGGEVSLMFGTGPTVVPHAKAGRLRLIATAGGKRSKSLPELPTVAETLPGVEVSAWYGVLAPAGTPKEIISKLHAETVRAIANPKIMQQISNAGAEAVYSTPEEFGAYIKTELARWGKTVKATGIAPE